MATCSIRGSTRSPTLPSTTPLKPLSVSCCSLFVNWTDSALKRVQSLFILVLDEQKAGNEWRERNVEACTLAMFEDASEKCHDDRAASAGRELFVSDAAVRTGSAGSLAAC